MCTVVDQHVLLHSWHRPKVQARGQPVLPVALTCRGGAVQPMATGANLCSEGSWMTVFSSGMVWLRKFTCDRGWGEGHREARRRAPSRYSCRHTYLRWRRLAKTAFYMCVATRVCLALTSTSLPLLILSRTGRVPFRTCSWLEVD